MERRTALKLLVAATLTAQEWPVEGEAVEHTQAASNQKNTPSFEQVPDSGFEWLHMGEVKPTGWIREQIQRDLNTGFAGCLDKLCPEANSDIFVGHRNTQTAKNNGNAAGQFWWNGETEGNWRTGQIMMAYLVDDAVARQHVDKYVRRILASQDADGYLGIFGPDLRYTEQSELWTQACLLRGLLAYAELAHSDEVMTAVHRAVDLTVHIYRSGQKPLPTGQSHDLMFIDVLEHLFELTGDAKYPEFALWYYDHWSQSDSKLDATLPSLLDLNKGFFAHGAHTFENIRVPLWLASATRRPDLINASTNALLKIQRYQQPSGSGISDELIKDRSPDPTLTEYEYCATKELQVTLQSAFQKSGRTELADLVETIWFNAAQGSRLSDGTAISYLSSDNRLRCDQMTPDSQHPQKRNKFSPTHMDVAVCCNPNATQVAALFVRGMWLRNRRGGLVASLYGPSTLTTKIGHISVRIEEQTNYPFESVVVFSIFPETDVDFPIWLRNPSWSPSTKVIARGATIEKHGGFWHVSKKWRHGDTIRVEFAPEIRRLKAVNREVAILYGPLLFAEPIPARKKIIKTYSVGHFEDSIYEPEKAANDSEGLPSRVGDDAYGLKVVHASTGKNPLRPFDVAAIEIHGRLVSGSGESAHDIVLVPIGNAPVLRRVTLPEVQEI